MAYRLIAIDIDGTLLNSQGSISPRTHKAILAAQEKGAHIVLNTGRLWMGVKKIYESLHLKSAIVCSGGAQIYNEEKEPIYECKLTNEDAKAIVKMAHDDGIYFQTFTADTYLFEKHTSPYTDRYAKAYGFYGKEVPNLSQMETIETPKVLFFAPHEEILSITPKYRALFPHLNLVSSQPISLEIMCKEATKGNALAFMAKYYGIPMEETIAFGDSELDNSMIEAAALGIAMGNAIPATKAIADEITASNDEDGVALAIEKFVLEA